MRTPKSLSELRRINLQNGRPINEGANAWRNDLLKVGDYVSVPIMETTFLGTIIAIDADQVADVQDETGKTVMRFSLHRLNKREKSGAV